MSLTYNVQVVAGTAAAWEDAGAKDGARDTDTMAIPEDGAPETGAVAIPEEANKSADLLAAESGSKNSNSRVAELVLAELAFGKRRKRLFLT